jgi:hypothetical protein
MCSFLKIKTYKKSRLFPLKKAALCLKRQSRGLKGPAACIFCSYALEIQSGRPRKYDYYEHQDSIQYPDNAAFQIFKKHKILSRQINLVFSITKNQMFVNSIFQLILHGMHQ